MSRNVLRSVVRLTSLLCLTAAIAFSQGPPQVLPAEHHDVSPPLRNIPAKLESGPLHEQPLYRFRAPGQPGTTDPVIQSSVTASVPTTAGLGFAGVGNGDYGFTPNAAPPDTNGAVGATQYVQWVNESFAVFDKATGQLLYGPAAGNTLWSGFGGGCQTNNDGDPIAQYDKAANRWVMAQFSVSTTPYLLCVAVSATSDATGSWYRYSFSQPNFPDYPKVGVWPDGYYVSYNMFQGNTFAGGRSCAMDRSKMLSGLAASQICFQLSTAYGGLLPSDLDGSTQPPAGAPNYYVAFGSNSLQVWKFHADFTTPSNSTFPANPATLTVASFSEACGGGTCIPQGGVNQKLDSLGDRLMYRLAYRNFGDHQAMVVNHSVTAGTSVGVRWYELRIDNSGTVSVYQQGTYAPDANYRWMGSIAMDQSGNMALGYSISSGSMYPSIRYTGRVPTDTLGTMEAENSIFAGSGSQSGFNLNRWGDYSAISVDPVDDCTFWYTNEYEKATGAFNWSTRIASFKFPSCGATTAPAAPANLAAVAGNAQVGLTWSGSSGATSYNVLRGVVPSGEAGYKTGITQTSYTDTGATNGTTYYYVVQAVNSIGTSPNSNEASATPTCSIPPAPTGLTATAGNAQVALSWSAVSSATSYNVQRSTDGVNFAPLATSTGTSYTDLNLTNGTTYYYLVSAASSCGTGANAGPVSATPNAPAVPAAPTGLTATAGRKKVSLTWNAVAGATSYNVLRNTTGSTTSYTTIATGVTSTSATNTGLTSGTTYYYVVQAVNSAGPSGFSNQASATPR